MRQVLAAFQEEQVEHCEAIGNILLDLEHNPQHPQRDELIVQLFREAHSLKGGARAAGLEPVEQLAHGVEDVFSAVRDGQLALTAQVCDPVYTSLEAIGTMMTHVAAGSTASIEPYQPLLEQLSSLLEPADDAPAQESDENAPAAADAEPETPEPVEDESAAPSGEQTVVRKERRSQSGGRRAEDRELRSMTDSVLREGSTGGRSSDDAHWESASSTVRLSTAMLDTLMSETGELIISAARAQQQARDARKLTDIPANWRRIWRQVNPILKKMQEQQPELQPTVHHLHDRRPNIALRSASMTADARVDYDTVVLLDALLRANAMIGELEQRLSEHARRSANDSARLSTVTNRMQDQIRRTRMLPLATLLNPLRVQLREMARMADKQVVLETDDGGAEADRQVLEGLREVLLHLLRNGVDHGIEATETRASLGKPEHGTITMHATVSGDYLDMAISDDGAGLDVEAIRQKAIEQGLLSDNDLTRVSEQDIVDLIFLPGFSTRQTVDRLSGRGVGLDVVRSNVERMHGSVAVQSTAGRGCTFRIRVPLSLTSSHGLLLSVGRATYMLPLESIQRIVPVALHNIREVEGRGALVLDGHPITLLHMADLLGEGTQRKNQHLTARDAHNGTTVSGTSLALLLGSGERQVACMVDAVLGEQELVVHRLPAPLQRVRFIAGATILPDGRVVPILDLVDVLRAAIGSRGMITVTSAPAAQQRALTVVVADDSITTRTLEKNILEAAGYTVHLATDGVEAFNVLQRLMEDGGCDLLLSDIDMPNLNGFDLTTKVRADTTLKHLPIVLVTSLDTTGDRERGMNAGADAYIVKRSFDQQTLLDTIERLV
jgi:two-component system chemotaxis sensor kinase CheA